LLARFIDAADDDDDTPLDEHDAVDLLHDEGEAGINIMIRQGDWDAPEPAAVPEEAILARLLALNQERSLQGEP
jgi:hypothetical protein